MSTFQSLWPADLVADEPASPPAILRQQADALADNTSSRLRARVESSASSRRPWDRGKFPDLEYEGATYLRHRLIIVVPALEDYEVELLHLYQGSSAYPVVARLLRDEEYYQLSEEKELTDWLREALASAHARELIRTLLSAAA